MARAFPTLPRLLFAAGALAITGLPGLAAAQTADIQHRPAAETHHAARPTHHVKKVVHHKQRHVAKRRHSTPRMHKKPVEH
jgi:hypothetical protein